MVVVENGRSRRVLGADSRHIIQMWDDEKTDERLMADYALVQLIARQFQCSSKHVLKKVADV
jgi:hypothetical protein